MFVWLTDDPELNKQSIQKIDATSSVLTAFDLVPMDGSVDQERLDAGKVYFINTQKLGIGTSYVKPGDGRQWTFWEALANTAGALGPKFVLIIDEAHRGARGKDAAEAETIMQKFVKGSTEIAAVPLVVGVSATPDRFIKLCNDARRPLMRVDVEASQVRASGLLKEWVDLYHPDEVAPSDVTMLLESIAAWKKYCTEWGEYAETEREKVPSPVLLVQVEDAKAGSHAISRTDLAMVVGTLDKTIPHEAADGRWIAHAFQDETAITVAGRTIRRLPPSKIDADPDVKTVLFKTSLNTGWDCPRAETMVSFRSARDETNIAQLVGRMVRTPLARRVEDNEHLNTVALYLPYYHQKTVEKVVARLVSEEGVPPIEVRSGREAVSLRRAPGMEECFKALASLPTYVVPRSRPMKPVARVARLAALLAELGLIDDPVKTYRAALVQVLRDEHAALSLDETFKEYLQEAAVLDIRRRRVAFGSDDTEETGQPVVKKVAIADKNVEDLYNEAGRLLGEGLHREYLRSRLEEDAEADARAIKLELYAIVTTGTTLTKIDGAADALRKQWVDANKAAIREAGEQFKIALREIEAAGTDPALAEVDPPDVIEVRKAETPWSRHLYVAEDDDTYREDFRSSWENRVLEAELGKDEIVGWLRNFDRKPWSLCVPRLAGTKWVRIYPDFIFFRKTTGGILADIVDPHLLADQDAPARAAALAKYAADHRDSFGRVELVIFENNKDEKGKRLDLLEESIGSKVAGVTTHEHLRQIFDSV